MGTSTVQASCIGGNTSLRGGRGNIGVAAWHLPLGSIFAPHAHPPQPQTHRSSTMSLFPVGGRFEKPRRTQD
jgi:hypothetical protein